MPQKLLKFQMIQNFLNQLDLALFPIDGVFYLLNQHSIAIVSENIITCED